MGRLTPITAIAVPLLAALSAGSVRGATLASLVAGGTLETPLIKFDQFTYTGYAGGPSAAAITVTPFDLGGGVGALQFSGNFTATTFATALINYRATAKADAVIFAAGLDGSPTAGTNGFAVVDETFNGGLDPLSVYSQAGTLVTSASETFPPRTSLTVHSQVRLNGTPTSPSSVTIFQQSFSATPLPSDFDLDGDVDGADFLVWQRGIGPPPKLRTQGDADGDEDVDNDDLLRLRMQFGQGPAPVRAIPEPCGGTLAAAAAAMMLRIRRACMRKHR